MDEYRMLNDIHKPSSTRVEVSTSSAERDEEDTDKSRFSEKEIGDPTGRPKLPVPDNLHKDYPKTIEPEQRWTLVHERPLTTETEQSDKSELSDIPSTAFKGYKRVWDYGGNTHLSESPPSAPTTPKSPATPPQTPPAEKAITGSQQVWGPIEAPITKKWLLHIEHMGPVSLPPRGGPWELQVVAAGVPDANRDRRTRRRLQLCLVPFSGISWVVNT